MTLFTNERKKIDEAYAKYCGNFFTPPEDPDGESGLLAPQLWSVRPIDISKEMFIEKLLTDDKFNKKWSNNCTVEMPDDERVRLFREKHNVPDNAYLPILRETLDKQIPKRKIIEEYEKDDIG